MKHKMPREYFGVQRNARGKHTPNPGYKPGNHWVECEVCGCDIRAFDIKLRWDGLRVCPDDWETRHPQDFVRARHDDIRAKEPVRTESPFIESPGGGGVGIGGGINTGGGTVTILDYSAVSIPLLDFIPGQAIPGNENPVVRVVPIGSVTRPPTSTIPPGSFNTNNPIGGL